MAQLAVINAHSSAFLASTIFKSDDILQKITLTLIEVLKDVRCVIYIRAMFVCSDFHCGNKIFIVIIDIL